LLFLIVLFSMYLTCLLTLVQILSYVLSFLSSLFFIYLYILFIFYFWGKSWTMDLEKYSLEQILGQVLGKFAPTQVLG